MAGREEENTHEIALSGDVNEIVEEIDGLEIVDDDDENSEDDSDDFYFMYVLK
jgi:ribosomal 30S subunit maturation factor RimM